MISDVLNMPDFWPNERDHALMRNSEIKRQNYFSRKFKQPSLTFTYDPYLDNEPLLYESEEQKSMGQEVSDLLMKHHGLIYDKKTNTMSFENMQHLHIIPQVLNNEILISYKSDDYFLNEIIKDINGTYKASFFTATLFLLRKLFENCLWILLENRFPKNINGNLDLYFDTSRGRNRDFSELIQSIRRKENDFGMKDEIERLLNRIEHLKDVTNSIVHKLVYKGSMKEIKEIPIPEIFELIKKIDTNDILAIKRELN